MGSENSQISFPIESKNNFNKIKINNTKNYKDISNKAMEIKHKQIKKNKNLKGSIISRISATPDRNLNIPGINKEAINNNKRYGSYEKSIKAKSNNIKNKNYGSKNSVNYNNKAIFYITNLINTIYSVEIENELKDTNIFNSGTKNINFGSRVNNKNVSKNDGINIMFDAIFKYNFFNNNINKLNKKVNNKYRYNSPKIKRSISDSNEPNENENSKNINKYNNINNIKINENINQDNQNATLILNKVNIENEVISINNKKSKYEYYNNNKKYYESKIISDSESGFLSSEEMSLLNNIQKMDIKRNEEDASESQTDKQEVINHNLTNKNKLKNNYFISSQLNQKINNKPKFNNKELNIISNFNNIEYNAKNLKNLNNDINIPKRKFSNKLKSSEETNNNINTKNIIISYDIKNKKKELKEDEIILMNNESNRDDDNNTYMEILLAMTEKKPDYKINTLNNIHKIQKEAKINKNKEIRKNVTPTPNSAKREITPQNIGNKREITPKASTYKVKMRTKKIPLKKIPLNGNINNNYNNKKMIYNSNNSNNNISIKKISDKKFFQKSINSNINNNISPNKPERKSINKSNNNSPILKATNNNKIKNSKISESPSPSNSPDPSPLNNFNNNYKDRYSYLKIKEKNNSMRKNKKIENKNNTSNGNSINGKSNAINQNSKNSNLYYKINNNGNNYNNNYIYSNNYKKILRNTDNKNKIIYFKKEALSGNSFNKTQNNDKIIQVDETRNKSNDQKYSFYNSKNVLYSSKKNKNKI